MSPGVAGGRLSARLVRLSLALAACMGVGACANTGDFGRPSADLWNDTVLPQLGFWAASSRGEAASPFRLTDDENQLRDRAWRFVMPAHEKNYFEREVSNFIYARVLPVEKQSSDVGDYFRALMRGSFASQASRYARLAEDANADRLLIAPFRMNAQRVVAADRVRIRTVDGSPLVPPEKRDPAFERVVENEGLILWVCERVNFRIEGYRYALANLVVETPSREAIRAERTLMALEAEAVPMCKLPLVGAFGTTPAAPPPPSQRAPLPPVVYKG